METDCQNIEQLLAAYTLEALEIEEKSQVETHLETCAACQQALRDYQTVSDGLMAALSPVLPSARVRARLLIQTAPKAQSLGGIKRWRGLFPRLLPLAGLVTLLVLAVFNFNLLRDTNQILKTQETLAQQNKAYQTSFALLTYPSSKVAVIDDGNIYGTLIYDPDGQVAVLNVWGLEDLPQGKAYQIWLIEPNQKRVSGGVFQFSEETGYVAYVIESTTSLDAFTEIGITIEPETGSPGPTGPRVFGVQL